MDYVGLPPIRVTYTPDDGFCAMADGDVMKHVEWVAGMVVANGWYEEKTSNELVIMAYRLMVKRGTIPHTDICILFTHPDSNTVEELRFDRLGNLNNYPRGFCAAHDAILHELIDWEG